MSATDVTSNGYELIQRLRAQILGAIRSLADVATRLEMPERVDELEKLAERVSAENFKVFCGGEFKRGKSTTINALLGQKVLPAYAVPTTATINEVKWGDEPSAVLHPRAVEGVAGEPRRIDVAELEQHVVVGDDDTAINPYERVEVFWPLDLLRGGVMLCDTPGLNDTATREQISMGYLSDVDAVVFVFAADMLGSRSELHFIDNVLRPLGHDHLFLVVNRINQVDPADRQTVIERGTRRIADRTQLGADGVFFVNARGALEARAAGDKQALAETGFLELEGALERFLTRDRGKMKILAPAKAVSSTLTDLLTQEIPEREAMLAESLETLEQRVAEAQQPLQGLESERDLILERLYGRIQAIRSEATAAARSFYDEIGAQVPKWAVDFTPTTELRIFRSNKEQMEQLAEEVSAQIETRLATAFEQWQGETLQPLLTERVAALSETLNEQAEEFLAQAEAVRVELAGLDGRLREGVAVEGREVSALERVVAAGGGLIVAGPGAAMMGASDGVQGLVKGLVPQLAVGVIGALVFGPGVILIAAMMGVAAIQAMLNREKNKQKVQEEIGKEAARTLRAMQDSLAEDVGAAVEAHFEELRTQLAAGLQREITRVHEQIDVVLAAKREGEAGVEERRARLREARRDLDRISGDVHDVLSELVAL